MLSFSTTCDYQHACISRFINTAMVLIAAADTSPNDTSADTSPNAKLTEAYNWNLVTHDIKADARVHW